MYHAISPSLNPYRNPMRVVLSSPAQRHSSEYRLLAESRRDYFASIVRDRMIKYEPLITALEMEKWHVSPRYAQGGLYIGVNDYNMVWYPFYEAMNIARKDRLIN